MKNLISFVILFGALCLAADAPDLAGKWQFAMETPHGNLPGVLTVQQDGAKLSGSFEIEQMGTCGMTGSIDGIKVSMKGEMHGRTFTLIGTVTGNSMTGTMEQPHGGAWKATRK